MLRLLVTIAFTFVLVGNARAETLFDAARQGDIATVKALLGSGVFVDEVGRNAATPLIAATLEGKSDVAFLLIEAGANVMARNEGGFTALHAASYAGLIEIMQRLLENGAKLEDDKNVSGQTPIFMAGEEGHADITEFLLLRGADASAIDRDGFSVLTQSWAKRHFPIVRLLKEHGAVCQSAKILGSEDFHQQCVQAGQ